jgi:hypothetical protein
MRQKSLTPALACLPVVLAGTTAQAQSAQPAKQTPPFNHALSVTSGVNFTDRLDATASPRPYAGVGTAAAVRYRFEPGKWSFTAEANGTRGTYQPRDNLTGSEHAMAGGVAMTVEREAAVVGNTEVRVGLALDTRAELLEHRYADVASTLSSFVSGFATLGPTGTVRRNLGSGEVAATVVLPMVGLAHQPYANTRQEREPFTVRAIGLSALRGASFGARYESSKNARFGIVAEYHLRAFDYTGGWRMRSLTNSTAIGIVSRFGTKGR